MNEQLRIFHDNTLMFNAVEEYFSAKLNQYALEQMMARQDTTGIPDALKVLTKAFSELREEFSPPADKNTTNHAR